MDKPTLLDVALDLNSFIWRLVYNGLTFLVVLVISAFFGRIFSSLTFDYILVVPGLSPYYWDAVFMSTLFPYLLVDGVISLESKVKFLRPRTCGRSKVIIAVRFAVLSYILGISYGIVIASFFQRLRFPGKFDMEIHSPFESIVKTTSNISKKCLEIWNGEISWNWNTGGLLALDEIQTKFLFSGFLPVYFLIRSFDRRDRGVRLSFFQFLHAAICQCFGLAIKSFDLISYVVVFMYELVLSLYFVFLPIFVAFLLNADTPQYGVFATFTTLFAVCMSVIFVVLESLYPASVKEVFQKYVSAQYLSLAFLVSLSSLAPLIMFYNATRVSDSESFWYKHGVQMQLFVTSISYSAYCCSKIIIKNYSNWYSQKENHVESKFEDEGRSCKWNRKMESCYQDDIRLTQPLLLPTESERTKRDDALSFLPSLHRNPVFLKKYSRNSYIV